MRILSHFFTLGGTVCPLTLNKLKDPLENTGTFSRKKTKKDVQSKAGRIVNANEKILSHE